MADKPHPWWENLTAEESMELAAFLKEVADGLPKDGREPDPSISPLGDLKREIRMWELIVKAAAKHPENLPENLLSSER